MYRNGVYGLKSSESLKSARSLGIDVIFTDLKNVEKVKEHGFKAYVCVWVFKTSDTSHKIENVYGKKMLWNCSGCPNNPKLRELSIQHIRNVMEHDVDGIVLDGVRFPSPASGLNSFLSCFCKHCDEKARELGFNLDNIKSNLKDKRGIDIISCTEFWRFRCESIIDYVKEVKDIVNSELGAALFTPTLSQIVGQDYYELSKMLDFIQPMIYHKGSGLACMNYEIYRLIEELDIREVDTLYKILNYDSLKLPAKELKNGLPTEIIGEEVRRAEMLMRNVKLRKAKLTPILFVVGLNPEEIKKCVQEIKCSKLDGIVYFANDRIMESLSKAATK